MDTTTLLIILIVLLVLGGGLVRPRALVLKPVISTCSFAFQVGLAQRRHGEAREHAGERRNRQLNMASRTWFHFAFVPNYDVRGRCTSWPLPSSEVGGGALNNSR